MRQLLFRCLVLAAALCTTCRAAAQSPDNLLVIVNDASEASKAIAGYYVQKRAIPRSNVIHLKAPITDEISRAAFVGSIEQPIASALSSGNLQDRILYIVLTKGIPLRIAGTPGRSGTGASVDSELTLLYRRMSGAAVPVDGPVPNPFYAGPDSAVHATFSHAAQDIYLVTRLDGFSVADATSLVDRSLAAKDSIGTIVLDQRGASADKPNEWLATASERLRTAPDRVQVLLEATPAAATLSGGALGYYSWGSNDPALKVRAPAVTFAAGALASMFLSTDARTMTEPPADWKPGAAEYAASSQSLTADLVRAGVAGAAGQVAEPYLDAAVRPEILFPAYVSGLNLAEAFYRAMPSLSWQTVILGDPLCAPFRSSTAAAGEFNPPIDPETDLPAQFSARRLENMERTAALPVRKLLLRADARRAKGDLSGAVNALEQATAADVTLSNAFRALGVLYEATGQSDKARTAYARTLENNPNDVVALNNLAYATAVRDHRPADALPLAERAFRITNGAPLIADTLGWIKHLLGDDAGALPLLERAINQDSANIDLQLHAAVVFAAAGRLEDAARALKTARELDPTAVNRDEYRAAQRRIGGVSPGGGS
ncbi:MAG TPA: TIGR03790 family protein [Vicinamibacterales bacterium]|nr:TIGR03790 family protein [Vicinamibacterales bacterium]